MLWSWLAGVWGDVRVFGAIPMHSGTAWSGREQYGAVGRPQQGLPKGRECSQKRAKIVQKSICSKMILDYFWAFWGYFGDISARFESF